MTHQTLLPTQARRTHSRGERGQGLVEYALILVLVAVVVIVILALLGPAVTGVYCQITGALGGNCGLYMTEAEAITYCTENPSASVSMFVWAELGEPPEGSPSSFYATFSSPPSGYLYYDTWVCQGEFIKT